MTMEKITNEVELHFWILKSIILNEHLIASLF